MVGINHSSRVGVKGLTLIELLVVVIIIATLIGLILASVNGLLGKSEKVRTRAALAMISQAIAATGVEAGQTQAQVEHPMAASAAPRQIFHRKTDGTIVTQTGDGIKTTDISYVATADQARVLLADDRFADPAAPQFFGMRRDQMSVIGSTTKWVTQYRRISGPGQTGRLIEPDLGRWIDESFLRESITDATSTLWEETCAEAVSLTLGPTFNELLVLSVIRSSDNAGSLVVENRLRQSTDDTRLASSSEWDIGMVHDGSNFVSYDIRGTSVVDLWGTEILVSRDENGRLRLESAGPDGRFRWDPGPDGIFQTAATDSDSSGDDIDATSDNVVIGE